MISVNLLDYISTGGSLSRNIFLVVECWDSSTEATVVRIIVATFFLRLLQ